MPVFSTLPHLFRRLLLTCCMVLLLAACTSDFLADTSEPTTFEALSEVMGDSLEWTDPCLMDPSMCYPPVDPTPTDSTYDDDPCMVDPASCLWDDPIDSLYVDPAGVCTASKTGSGSASVVCCSDCTVEGRRSNIRVVDVVRSPIGWSPTDFGGLSSATSLVADVIAEAGGLQGMPPGSDEYFGILADVLRAAPGIGANFAMSRGYDMWIVVEYDKCTKSWCVFNWDRLIKVKNRHYIRIIPRSNTGHFTPHMTDAEVRRAVERAIRNLAGRLGANATWPTTVNGM